MKKYKIKAPEGFRIVENKDITNRGVEKITLSLIPIREKKEELPKTWKELENVEGYFVNYNSTIMDYEGGTTKSNKNIWPTRKLVEASIALTQLCQLRDRYNDGWTPDYTNTTPKYMIGVGFNEIRKEILVNTSHILTFKTRELRNTFLENFKDLIEQAKPLL